MSRELSAVIACVQQIELAVDEHESYGQQSDAAVLKELRDKIRSFFSSPSLASAKNILHFISLESATPNKVVVLKKKVEVDGMMATLEALGEELKEVLDDLSSETV